MHERATFILVLALALAACAARTTSVHSPTHAATGEVTSNVRRGDYAGSAACAKCHDTLATRWFGSPMHNMTRAASDASIQAPFSGVALRFKDDTVDLALRDGKRFVRVHSTRFGDGLYRVTRVIGGHHREDYAGVAVASFDAAPTPATADEVVLPVSYLLWSKKYRYKGYSVMSRERPGVAVGPVWNRTCIFCHNTQPYLSTLLGTLVDPAEHRHAAYQGEVVDPLLPALSRWRTVVDDAPALERDLQDDIEHLSGRRFNGRVAELAWRDVEVTRSRFTARDLIEVGIGCEACHGGAREHAEHPEVRTSMRPHSAALHVQGGSGDAEAVRAQRINRTCARCHQVLFSRYPYTWEGGRRDASPGGSHINSGEARDFLLGACSTRADCTLCHDPHAPDNGTRTARLETKEGDAVCTRCHKQLAGDDALRKHAHHDPNGAGGRCVACHMPKKNMSLEGRLTRYHRIGSPTDSIKLTDRPLECALCHGDETVGKIAADIERLWGKHSDAALLTDVYGSLDANVLEATLARGKPHEQAVALELLGERKERRARASIMSSIAEQLVNAYPLVRFYAESALERITGESSPLDLYATDDEIRAQAAAWLAKHRD